MKKILAILLLTTAMGSAIAQKNEEENRGFKKENLFINGNFGLSFGNYTLINISPQLGYNFNQYLAAGVGINGQYISQKFFDNFGNDYSKQSLTVFGFNVFGRFYPFAQGFIQVQPEYNWISSKEKYYVGSLPEYKTKYSAPSLLVGAGANLQGALISIMYDVLQNKNSPYGNKPFVNIGFGFGLGR